MTKLEGERGSGEGSSRPPRPRSCDWCRRPLTRTSGAGRPRRYCTQACRQQAYVARRLAAAEVRSEGELAAVRRRFESLQDRVVLLGQAVADLRREEQGGEPVDPEAAYRWLLRHAVEVAEADPGPTRPEEPDGEGIS